MRGCLAAICALTLLAIAYLSVSLLILRPAGANYAVWFSLATFVFAESSLTLAALGTNIGADGAVRGAVLGGGTLLGAIGLWMIRRTVASPHFEGYALVLGWMLVIQAVFTIVVFVRGRRFRTA